MTAAFTIAATLTATTAVAWAGLYLIDLARRRDAEWRFLRGETDDLDDPAPLLGAHRARVETGLAVAMAVSGLATITTVSTHVLGRWWTC